MDAGTLTEPVTDVEFDVPEADDAVPCPYCDRPFSNERALTVHVGVRHATECTESEREAFEEITADEEYDLFTFHVKITIIIFVTYFTFTFLYALAWT